MAWKVGQGGEEDQEEENEIISHKTKSQINQCRLYKVSVVLEDIEEEVVS